MWGTHTSVREPSRRAVVSLRGHRGDVPVCPPPRKERSMPWTIAAKPSARDNATDPHAYSRRNFLMTTASSAAAPLVAGTLVAEPARAQIATRTHQPVDLELEVNGRRHRLAIDVRTSLLDALREHLAFTGTKKVCDLGQCGACTVLVGGRRVLSCLTPRGRDARPGDHHRGPRRPRRPPASHAAGLHRPRCLPVRLLHARPDHVGDRLRHRRARGERRRHPRIHEWKPVPLRRLPQHRRRHQAGQVGRCRRSLRCGRSNTSAPPHRRQGALKMAGADGRLLGRSAVGRDPGPVSRRRHQPDRHDENRRDPPRARHRHKRDRGDSQFGRHRRRRTSGICASARSPAWPRSPTMKR